MVTNGTGPRESQRGGSTYIAYTRSVRRSLAVPERGLEIVAVVGRTLARLVGARRQGHGAHLRAGGAQARRQSAHRTARCGGEVRGKGSQAGLRACQALSRPPERHRPNRSPLRTNRSPPPGLSAPAGSGGGGNRGQTEASPFGMCLCRRGGEKKKKKFDLDPG